MSSIVNFMKSLAKRLPPLKRLVEQRDSLLRKVDYLDRELAVRHEEVADLHQQIADLRHDLKQLRMQSGFPPGHFYSPIPAFAELAGHQDRIFSREIKPLPAIDLRPDAQLALLRTLAGYYTEMPFSAGPAPGLRYYFENDFYSYGDAIYLYSMIRHFRPDRIVEIGSGFSSAVILDTNELFCDGAIECTFIDPYPERLQTLLSDADRARATIIDKRLQDIDYGRICRLERNDILVIDSSHVSKIDSDVNHIIFQILPALNDGVLVHVHDIFFPFEYPEAWVNEGRFWNENYMLRAFLEFNSAFEIVFFADYLARAYRSELGNCLPLSLKNSGASLWLRRTGTG